MRKLLLWRILALGEFSLSANFRSRRIFALGEFSLSANFRSWRIFLLLANFSLGEFAFASPYLKGVRFAFASLFGRGNSSLSLRVRFGFLNEIYMPGQTKIDWGDLFLVVDIAFC